MASRSRRVNVPIGPFVADFLWRRERVIVETDGWKFHRGRTAFERDHERDLWLGAEGYAVVRLTHRQITQNPRSAASSVLAVLRRQAAA